MMCPIKDLDYLTVRGVGFNKHVFSAKAYEIVNWGVIRFSNCRRGYYQMRPHGDGRFIVTKYLGEDFKGIGDHVDTWLGMYRTYPKAFTLLRDELAFCEGPRADYCRSLYDKLVGIK